ncbi:MAG: hypothetical protein QF654_11895 [Alphaproteobacteria bacterium]|jgi:hypothetical protein|nr:hypothetical protein [Alphaproteobacteria bacterium]MDP6602609.1 hypothetical protein [Rhodospirillales bacterium]
MQNKRNESVETADEAGEWAGSETLFLMNCYDVWSATPSRDCFDGPAGATEEETGATE